MRDVLLDEKDIERLADAVAVRLGSLIDARPASNTKRYVDAATLAELFGVERDWVYAHQEQLGVIRLPSETGRRGRLRFDVEIVAAKLRRGTRRPPVIDAARPLGKASATTPLIEYDDAA